MTHPLHTRVEAAISRVKFALAAGEVLDEIERTHLLIPKQLGKRATDAGKTGGNAAWERSEIVATLAGYYTDAIRHPAAESDTPETAG